VRARTWDAEAASATILTARNAARRPLGRFVEPSP
jgi:hypothetical protein